MSGWSLTFPEFFSFKMDVLRFESFLRLKKTSFVFLVFKKSRQFVFS